MNNMHYHILFVCFLLDGAKTFASEGKLSLICFIGFRMYKYTSVFEKIQ